MNQPQVIPLPGFTRLPKRSPTFIPVIEAWLVLNNCPFEKTQSSYAGRASPISAPAKAVPDGAVCPPQIRPDALEGFPLGRFGSMVAPAVVPATRFSAPGADGPKMVLQELSLMAKF